MHRTMITSAVFAVALATLAAGCNGCKNEPDAGTDGGPTCTPGELLCDGNVLQMCDPSAVPVNVQDCELTGNVCVPGAGCRA